MSEDADLELRIKAFILTLSLNTGDLDGSREIAPQADLLELGLIDSFNIIEIAAFLEEEFGIRIDSEALMLANFSSIQALASLVRRLQAQAG